ncbi:ureidoglycolate lyase [Diplodia corticola]|uniref:Ureidoglycolate lyase n=1 Tax=Diplodia corticola TaxID=236234 RepID=A0A1J9QPT6_9PEZI|nr:ureidoglycolate lyase [Diplodia corticola]OJD30050.1 ureidoglycolate lyase [Diplodia corticola]
MKTSTSTILLAAAAGLVSQASAAVQMDVRYSDNMIDVGNLDLFAQTWQVLYDTSGNQRSVITDKSVGTDNNPCTSQHDSDPDLTVKIKMNGAWGQTPGLKQNQMRDGLIQSLWEVLRNIADRNKYDVYGGCSGFTWQEGTARDPKSPCGPVSATSCEAACKDASDVAHQVECSVVTTGYRVPSELRVTAYIDDQLQPDDLIVSIEAASNPTTGGCGIEGEIAKAVAGFIPVAGGLFIQGIAVGCTGVPKTTT